MAPEGPLQKISRIRNKEEGKGSYGFEWEGLEGWPCVTVLVQYFAFVDAHEPVESSDE